MIRGWILALIGMWTWAVGPVAFAEARCRIDLTAAAIQRLDIWGREWAGAKGLIAAHSTRHLAWVTDRSGTVLEALILVAVQNTDRRSGLTADYCRPQWIHCSGGD